MVSSSVSDWENYIEVLGEDYGLESDWSSSDSNQEEEVVEVKKKKIGVNQQKKRQVLAKKYNCPLCEKQYASTSGFRGHVIKKHNRPDLKAISNVNELSSSNVVPLTTSKEIKEDLSNIVKCTLQSLSTDEIHLCSWSKCGSSLVSYAEQLLQSDVTILCSFLSDYLVESLALPGPPDILKAVFQLRINKIFISGLTNVFKEIVGETENLEIFSQRFLTCFVKAFFQRQNEKIKVTQEIEIESLTNEDKETIHHITGEILSKLKKRYHNRSIELDILDNLIEKSSTDQRSTWTHRLDRGGLMYPSSKLLNLIILIERWIRELVNSEHLCYDSLIKIKSTILKYPLVTHLWENIVESQNKRKWLVLDNIMWLFVKSKLQKSRKNQKLLAGTKKSLRKDLKTMNQT